MLRLNQYQYNSSISYLQMNCIIFQFPTFMLSNSFNHHELQKLLQDMKLFLAQNSKVEGAFQLLVRLDAYLQSSTQKQQQQPLEKKFSQQSSSMKDEGQIQIIIDSDEQVKQAKVMEPRKFANLLDMFIFQYNFTTKTYQILSFYPIDPNSEMENDRKAILGLVLCPMKDHCIQKQKTNSMTQLHKLTANIPQNYPALILPNYSAEPNKYINIFEVKECIQSEGRYYLVDRYYCFITDGLAVDSLDSLCKQFKSRVFEERIIKVEQPFQVNCKAIEESIRSVLPYLVDKANDLPLALHEPAQELWVEKQLDFKIKSTKTTANCSLLLFVTYLAICEFKIILVVSKNMKHKLSDLVLSLQGSLKPMKYAYPVVFCSLNKDHCDFVQSPVPLIIGYWGSDNRKQKFIKQFEQYLTQHQKKNATPSIVIDLENYCVTNQTGFTNEDIFALQKINKHIKKYGKGNCLWRRISCFMKQITENVQVNKKQDKQWMKIFKQKIKNSQMFNILIGN